MQHDSIESLLLRHYGSAAPVPAQLEQRLSASVRAQAADEQARQRTVQRWSQRRVSRRRVLQLVTLSGAGLGALAIGINTVQATIATPSAQKPAYAW